MFPAARLKTYEEVRIMLSCDSNLHKSWWRPHEMLTCSCRQNLLKTDSLLKASTWFGADAQRLFVPTSTARSREPELLLRCLCISIFREFRVCLSLYFSVVLCVLVFSISRLPPPSDSVDDHGYLPRLEKLDSARDSLFTAAKMNWVEIRFGLDRSAKTLQNMWSNLARGVTTTQESYNSYEVTTVAE